MAAKVGRALLALTLLVASGGAAAQCSALLTWTWPTMNTDDTAYTSPDGGRVYWGVQAGNYPSSTRLTAAAPPTFCVTGLSAGLWFFQVSAISASGNESMLSNVASKQVLAAPLPPAAPTTFTMTPRPPAIVSTVLGTRLAYIGDTFDLAVPVIAGATRYEWQLQQRENNITNALTGRTATWTATRSGHVTPRVRACNADGCSAWLDSIALGWWAHFWIRPPSF